jgi:hypothetical protein
VFFVNFVPLRLIFNPGETKMNLEDIYAQFPRSQKYDLRWMVEDQMGPNVVWLAEALTQVMQLKPGMRVLDMGCGKAVSSIFLAKEFGVQVWATDLWIEAGENWQRVQKARSSRCTPRRTACLLRTVFSTRRSAWTLTTISAQTTCTWAIITAS